MFVDRSLVPVGKGDRFTQKTGISRLGDILVDSRKQPEGIVSAVGGMSCRSAVAFVLRCVLMPCMVVELYQRQRAAVVHLCRKHETDFLLRLFRGQMDHALDILYGVPIAIAVAQTAVNEGCGPGPCKCYEAVVGIPYIDHGIKCRGRGPDTEARKLFSPVAAQGTDFRSAHRLRVGVTCQKTGALLRSFFTQKESSRFRLSRLQTDHRRKGAAAVAAAVQAAAQIPLCHSPGITVSAVRAEKCRPVTAVGGDRHAGQAKETLCHVFFIYIFAVVQSIQIPVDLLADPAVFVDRPGDELGILQIDLVLLIAAAVGKLSVAGQGQLPRHGGAVLHPEAPHFMGPAKRYIIRCLCINAAVTAADDCIAGSVPALALIRI